MLRAKANHFAPPRCGFKSEFHDQSLLRPEPPVSAILRNLGIAPGVMPLGFRQLDRCNTSVGSSLRMVGTACLSSPRIAFSHDRFAVGLVISPSIFTTCSRLSSRARLLPCLARNFSMMRRRALRVSSAKLAHSADL